MPSLDTGSRYLDRKQKSSEAATLRYWDGTRSVEIEDAVIGQTPIGFSLSGSIIQSWQTTDFLVPVESLVINGREIVPTLGHRIERTVNGNTVRYVVAQTDDQRCFRYSDGVTRDVYRIHTREAA